MGLLLNWRNLSVGLAGFRDKYQETSHACHASFDVAVAVPNRLCLGDGSHGVGRRRRSRAQNTGTTTNTTVVASTGVVGGVSIDTNGLLSAAQPDALGVLAKLRTASLEEIPGDLGQAVAMRKVSLRRLEAAIEQCAAANKPLPDAVKYLAGLQHIRYIFVYPEEKDIVLVGPGEGWKVDRTGNIVGQTTGRPVMLLDDLLVALRTARAAANGGITCSIDPTQEGLARVRLLPAATVRNSIEAKAVGDAHATALGMERISVHGVPNTSHFARVLVAADYRMKRLAMKFDPSPVRGLPSYLDMVKAARGFQTPRFWLEPRYEALFRDDQGLAFELRGASVKAMTEEDHFAEGKIQHTGKAGPTAQRWADIMTDKYAELAVADPIFGQLQNCMELAVASALIAKERLPEKAGHSMPTLLESPAVRPETFNAPTQVESKASVLRRGRGWIISASGGVAINSWALADKVQPNDSLRPIRSTAAVQSGKWYRN